MSNNPDFQTPGSIKIAFPLRVDGAVLCGRQIGQQFAGLRVPAEEDLGVGRGVEGGIVNAAGLVERDITLTVALFGLREANPAETVGRAGVIGVEEHAQLRDAAVDKAVVDHIVAARLLHMAPDAHGGGQLVG